MPSQICGSNSFSLCCRYLWHPSGKDRNWHQFPVKWRERDHGKEFPLKWRLTGTASPCTVITKSVLSSGSLATSNEHLEVAKRSCTNHQVSYQNLSSENEKGKGWKYFFSEKYKYNKNTTDTTLSGYAALYWHKKVNIEVSTSDFYLKIQTISWIAFELKTKLTQSWK